MKNILGRFQETRLDPYQWLQPLTGSPQTLSIKTEGSVIVIGELHRNQKTWMVIEIKFRPQPLGPSLKLVPLITLTYQCTKAFFSRINASIICFPGCLASKCNLYQPVWSICSTVPLPHESMVPSHKHLRVGASELRRDHHEWPASLEPWLFPHSTQGAQPWAPRSKWK